MATDVGERRQFAVRTADDNCRLVSNPQNFEVTGLRELGYVSGQYPVAHDDFVDLERIDFGIDIEALIERVTGFVCGDEFADRHV